MNAHLSPGLSEHKFIEQRIDGDIDRT
jgi:hypothetical protein